MVKIVVCKIGATGKIHGRWAKQPGWTLCGRYCPDSEKDAGLSLDSITCLRCQQVIARLRREDRS